MQEAIKPFDARAYNPFNGGCVTRNGDPGQGRLHRQFRKG